MPKTHRSARTLLVRLVVGLLSVATVMVARLVVGDAATVGISFVANFTSNSVTQYAVGADGNVAPIHTVKGALTGLSEPTGVALDAAGTLYVTNFNGNSVTEYASPYTSAPIATISNSVSSPWGIAFDASGNLFVANQANNTVTEYTPPYASAPIATSRRGSLPSPTPSTTFATPTIVTVNVIESPSTIPSGRRRPPTPPAERSAGSTGSTHGDSAVPAPARIAKPSRTIIARAG